MSPILQWEVPPILAKKKNLYIIQQKPKILMSVKILEHLFGGSSRGMQVLVYH